jgi:hypothetical protein
LIGTNDRAFLACGDGGPGSGHMDEFFIRKVSILTAC